MVGKAVENGQPGLALTDHGNMSGTIRLYQECQKQGIVPFPGMEGYLVEDTSNPLAKRYHMGLVALTFEGYQALTWLSSVAHTREKFHRFPRFDWGDLAALSEEVGGGDLAVLTGCFFGVAQQTYLEALRGEWDGNPEELLTNVVRSLAHLFPTTLVEIQNHNITHDLDIAGDVDNLVGDEINDRTMCKTMVRVADALGLPVIATQDAHYLDKADKPAHSLMKRMVYGKGDKNEFPGDAFHLATAKWVGKHHVPDHWRRTLEACDMLLGMNTMHMPAIDNYRPRIPQTTKNPLKKVRQRCEERLDKFYDAGLLFAPIEKYRERLDYELDILGYLKIAGYFTLVQSYVEKCEREGVAIEARGSANSSLFTFLMGITQSDPLLWGLTFERFLSKDRKKPPDVDMDVEDRSRDWLVRVLDQKFGATHICTYSDLGARESDGKGSALVQYNSYLRKIYSKEDFARSFGPQGIQTMRDVMSYSHDDYIALDRLSKLSPHKSYGVHAAGLLLNGDDVRIADYVPTMLVASSNTTVTQFEGEDCEALGLTKLDILGQRTLTKMVRCQELMGRENPRDFTWIPYDNKKVCKEMSSGRLNTGVFTFEAYSMAKGARKMGLRYTYDAIVAQAIFRPACLDSGVTDLYLERRKNRTSVSSLGFPHEAFREATRDTYGLVIFQEQVLDIMRRLGLSYADINTFFAIVKDSGKGSVARNQEKAAEVKDHWDSICQRNGITGKNKDWAWQFVEGYTSYGFNKGHATGYGVRAYRDQYLKTYHPLEFMTATLEANAGLPKEREYILEARQCGIKIMSPDINQAGANWTMDRNNYAIRRGMASIKSISLDTAEKIEQHAPYATLDELVEKTDTGKVLSGGRAWQKQREFKGVIAALKEAGALSSLGHAKEKVR